MALELELTSRAAEFGVKVCGSADGRNETVIRYNATEGKLFIDSLETHRGVTELSGELLNRSGGTEFTKIDSRIGRQNLQRMRKEIGA